MGLLFFAEPATTYDLDIFCYLRQQTRVLISLAPLYANLQAKGYMPKGEHVEIHGIPVQFLIPSTPLVMEALDQSVNKEFGGVPTRVFQYEYLLAIMVETGRAKDRARITQALESADPNQSKLTEILVRFNLFEKWSKIVE